MNQINTEREQRFIDWPWGWRTILPSAVRAMTRKRRFP